MLRGSQKISPYISIYMQRDNCLFAPCLASKIEILKRPSTIFALNVQNTTMPQSESMQLAAEKRI
jgi:hypothetical protein